jgi:hypothetical protein
MHRGKSSARVADLLQSNPSLTTERCVGASDCPRDFPEAEGASGEAISLSVD